METLADCIRRATESSRPNSGVRRACPPVAREFMVNPVVSFLPHEPIENVMEVMLRRGFSGAPVTDSQGKVVGIVSELDCMKLIAGGSFHQEHDIIGVVVGDVMTAPRAIATPDMDLFAVVHELLSAGVRRLPVVAADRLVGIVSRRDVLRVIRELYG